MDQYVNKSILLSLIKFLGIHPNPEEISLLDLVRFSILDEEENVISLQEMLMDLLTFKGDSVFFGVFLDSLQTLLGF